MLDRLRRSLANRTWQLSQWLRPQAAGGPDERSKAERAALAAWKAARGDQTLRLDYPLGHADLVIDAGGYEGQWSSDVYARYRCRMFIYEPVPQFAALITQRFAANPDIRVIPRGLAGATRSASLSLAGDASSVHADGSQELPVALQAAAEAFAETGVTEIALLKVNIEGAEYELLEHLLASGWMARIRDLQVQFHRFVPDAAARREALRQQFAATHRLTYDFPFVWENWRRRDAAPA